MDLSLILIRGVYALPWDVTRFKILLRTFSLYYRLWCRKDNRCACSVSNQHSVANIFSSRLYHFSRRSEVLRVQSRERREESLCIQFFHLQHHLRAVTFDRCQIRPFTKFLVVMMYRHCIHAQTEFESIKHIMIDVSPNSLECHCVAHKKLVSPRRAKYVVDVKYVKLSTSFLNRGRQTDVHTCVGFLRQFVCDVRSHELIFKFLLAYPQSVERTTNPHVLPKFHQEIILVHVGLASRTWTIFSGDWRTSFCSTIISVPTKIHFPNAMISSRNPSVTLNVRYCVRSCRTNLSHFENIFQSLLISNFYSIVTFVHTKLISQMRRSCPENEVYS